MKTLLSIAVLGLMSATPALAAQPFSPVQPFSPAQPFSSVKPDPAAASAPAPSVAAMGATGAAPAGAAPRSAKPTRYCVVQGPVTGTRLGRKICNTREGWLKQGFDPLNPQAE